MKQCVIALSLPESEGAAYGVAPCQDSPPIAPTFHPSSFWELWSSDAPNNGYGNQHPDRGPNQHKGQ